MMYWFIRFVLVGLLYFILLFRFLFLDNILHFELPNALFPELPAPPLDALNPLLLILFILNDLGKGLFLLLGEPLVIRLPDFDPFLLNPQEYLGILLLFPINAIPLLLSRELTLLFRSQLQFAEFLIVELFADGLVVGVGLEVLCGEVDQGVGGGETVLVQVLVQFGFCCE
jgi:hypothetical protein